VLESVVNMHYLAPKTLDIIVLGTPAKALIGNNSHPMQHIADCPSAMFYHRIIVGLSRKREYDYTPHSLSW